MAYQNLAALLNPEQFAQLEVVRKHLLEDPALLDKATPTTVVEEETHGS